MYYGPEEEKTCVILAELLLLAAGLSALYYTRHRGHIVHLPLMVDMFALGGFDVNGGHKTAAQIRRKPYPFKKTSSSAH